MPLELSWIPGGSVGFLINLFGFFELTMVVVRGREVCEGSTARLADPSESVMRIIRSMAMLVALAMPSLMANSSASGAVVLSAGALCQARFTPGWKSAGWTRR